MAISALPTAPSRANDPATFSARADALIAALATFVTEANALALDVTTKQGTASSAASAASGSANDASGYATAASGSASTAQGYLTQIQGIVATIPNGTIDDANVGTTKVYSSTKTEATYAKLGANTFTGAQIYADQSLSRGMLKDMGYTVVDKGNSGTDTQTYDYTAGSVQTSTCTGAHTIATSNWPPTGNLGEMVIIITNGGSAAITMPTISWLMPNGTTTTTFATYLAANTGRTALQASGVDQILLWTRDAGTTIYGKLI